MKARYFRLRFGQNDGTLDGSVTEIYILDENNSDITLNASRSYIVNPEHMTGSYNPDNAHDRNTGTYWYLDYYKTVYEVNPTGGITNAVIYDFNALVEVRRLIIIFRSTCNFIFECSCDNNLWVTCAANNWVGYSGSGSTDTYDIPANIAIGAHYFWGIKVRTHTAGATSNVKIKNFYFRDVQNRSILGCDSRFNSLLYDPQNWMVNDPFIASGAMNEISDEYNTVGKEILMSQKLYAPEGNSFTPYDSIYGMQMPYSWDYVGYMCPIVYWNNTNKTNNLAAALPAVAIDRVFFKFDADAPNKPRTVSFGYCDAVMVPRNTQTGIRYQPYEFIDLITIDDYTPYLSSGVDISGFLGTPLQLNGWPVVPDVAAPITTPSPAPGLCNHDVTVTLTRNENGTTYYKINDGSTQTYMVPLTFTESTNLTYWSVDPTGNIEDAITASYVIDRVAPITTPSLASGSYAGAQHVNLVPNKEGSIKYAINGSAFFDYTTTLVLSNDTMLEFYCTDLAGNIENVKTAIYTILASKIIYRIDGGPWIEYTVPFEVKHYQKVEAAIQFLDGTLSSIDFASYNIVDTSDQWVIIA